MSNTRLSEMARARMARVRSRNTETESQPEIKPLSPTLSEGERAIETIKALKRGNQMPVAGPSTLSAQEHDARIAHVTKVATSAIPSSTPQEPDPRTIANEARVIHAQRQAAGSKFYSFAEAVTEARTRRGLKPFPEVQKVSMVGGE